MNGERAAPTVDISAIRAALAAAKATPYGVVRQQVLANAPVWLASLISEVERLRAERSEDDDIDAFVEEQVERAHKAERERDGYYRIIVTVTAERDAALAECERLRADLADCRREVEDWKEQAGHEL